MKKLLLSLCCVNFLFFMSHLKTAEFEQSCYKEIVQVSEKAEGHDDVKIAVNKNMCDKCGKVFTQKGHLKTHLMLHQGIKDYVCNFENCTQAFSRKYNLIVHQRKHTGQKPYECDVCSKKFKVSSNFKVHQRTHTGETPYTCDFEGCDREFRQLSHLHEHQRIHTGERPYCCIIKGCKMAFTQKIQLTRHLEKHEDHVKIDINSDEDRDDKN